MDQERLQEIVNLIRKSSSILLLTHKNPDGDAIGSLLGLYHILKDEKEVYPFIPEEIPYEYSFLEGVSNLLKKLPDKKQYSLGIVVDCASKNLLPLTLPIPGLKGPLVSIDHHPPNKNDKWYDILWYEEVSAVGEQIYMLGMELFGKLSSEAAEAIYLSILTDTGSFRYSSTTSQTHFITAKLLEQGVDPWKVARWVYESYPVERMRLLGETLTTMKLKANGTLCYMIVTKEMLERNKATLQFTDNFVNYARGVKGVEVGIIFREEEKGWRTSLRSKGKINVREIAEQFGGGGHDNASGFIYEGNNLEEVLDKIEKFIVNRIRLGGEK